MRLQSRTVEKTMTKAKPKKKKKKKKKNIAQFVLTLKFKKQTTHPKEPPLISALSIYKTKKKTPNHPQFYLFWYLSKEKKKKLLVLLLP